ncbi:PucR family transcriptional regulator [Gordonia rhizosphera]|uniref:CdaR family transcriptional regulator n=1 Tax=Gordonia rhizosphera NBRC 16068 TaxID=1108045 RepID=K6UZA4_9ACTN|nr:helix-turn-helix domain-containing protein [Gordonia rhizosphera]GAB88793.1 hypothetical protein GORHZ_040_00260 [Gordonia rhizosphera NBRC 16068]
MTTFTDSQGTLAEIGASLSERSRTIVDGLYDALLAQVPDLADDDALQGRLRASIESNVSQLLHLMVQPVDLELIEPTAGALQYAQLLAQHGVPLSSLWRAYHICNSSFFLTCLAELDHRADEVRELADETTELSTLLNTYLDRVLARIGPVYDAERDRWLRRQSSLRADRLNALLTGRVTATAEVEAALGYRLATKHLALIVWDDSDSEVPRSEGLARAIARISDRIGCRQPPLSVPQDDSTLWAWLSLPADTTESADLAGELERVLCEQHPNARAALGEPGVGVDGFSRSHRNALAARSVALVATPDCPRVVAYREVSGLSFLCHDLTRAREWVGETLGELAIDDEPHARLREGLSAFLGSGGSLSAAADQLGCHKNTIHNRVRRAEELLGRRATPGQIDLQLALQARRWLGATGVDGAPAAT